MSGVAWVAVVLELGVPLAAERIRSPLATEEESGGR